MVIGGQPILEQLLGSCPFAPIQYPCWIVWLLPALIGFVEDLCRHPVLAQKRAGPLAAPECHASFHQVLSCASHKSKPNPNSEPVVADYLECITSRISEQYLYDGRAKQGCAALFPDCVRRLP